MAEIVYNTDGEFGKYILQELKTPVFSEGFNEFYKTYAKRLLWMDSKNVPGAFQMNISWYMAASDCRPLFKHDEHRHGGYGDGGQLQRSGGFRGIAH